MVFHDSNNIMNRLSNRKNRSCFLKSDFPLQKKVLELEKTFASDIEEMRSLLK